MKARAPQWHKKCMLATALFLLGPAIYIMAQPPLYGPEYPPPEESSITWSGSLDDEEIGRAAGKDIFITNITLANSTAVYWSTLEKGVKLSLDGPEFTGIENMVFSVPLSNLGAGLLVWTGETTIEVVNPSGPGTITKAIDTKMILTVVNINNQPVTLIPPAATGLGGNTGGAVSVTDNQMYFRINLKMQVSEDGVNYFPHLDYYDSQGTLGEYAYSSYDFGFYWENDPPELVTNDGANVDEGDTVIIDNSMLDASDVETRPGEVLIIIDPLKTGELPAHGTLWMNDEQLAPGDTVLTHEIASEELSYIHDGSETTKDSVAFSVVDDDGAYFEEDGKTLFYFPITITPVDDPPVLETNAGATIDEDAKIILTEAMLLTTDPESGPGNITYTVDPASGSDYPMNGLLSLNSIPINDGGTFTQADIAAGLVAYDHNGTETLNDGFVFTVEDEFGHLADNNGNDAFFFAITINLVNDDPKLTKLVALEIMEGGSGVVGNMLLAASDEESPPEEISFTIDPNSELNEPNYGEVLLDGTVLNDGESFTMADVNANKVTYQHDGSEGHTDFFLFNISDPQGGVAHDGEFTLFHFNINITNVNDPPTLENPIADHSTKAEESYTFTFPENTFHDPDVNDQLSYEATRGDESDLPGWLTFDGNSRTFSGTPHTADVGTINIKIVASDMDNMEVFDDFNLEITPAVNVENDQVDDWIEIGPNPFRDVFHVTLKGEMPPPQRIVVFNMLGDRNIIETVKHADTYSIEMHGYPSGIYFIRTETPNGIYVHKLLKE